MMESCYSYKNGCNAQLCPLDPSSLDNALWYPDETICRRRGLPDTKWIKTQRKIAKKAKDCDTFYQFSDLVSIQRVSAGIKGHNPNYKVKTTHVKRHSKSSHQDRENVMTEGSTNAESGRPRRVLQPALF